VGKAIREHAASGKPAVSDRVKGNPEEDARVKARVQEVLDREINPAVGMHGGFIRLLDVKNHHVYVQLGGGCQGCGMADVTLKQGIETLLKERIPEIVGVVDQTDHAGGANPYYRPGKG
jgi:Fe/S biogenesis protein NfuA